MKMHSLLRTLILLVPIFFAGCHGYRDAPLFGKWVFDREYTQAHLPKELVMKPNAPTIDNPFPNGFPSDSKDIPVALKSMMNDTLKPSLTQWLIAASEGITFTITPKLITGTDGNVQTYRVIERSPAHTWSLQTSDGKIQTWVCKDGHLSCASTGDVHFMFYYKQAAPEAK